MDPLIPIYIESFLDQSSFIFSNTKKNRKTTVSFFINHYWQASYRQNYINYDIYKKLYNMLLIFFLTLS